MSQIASQRLLQSCFCCSWLLSRCDDYDDEEEDEDKDEDEDDDEDDDDDEDEVGCGRSPHRQSFFAVRFFLSM